MITSWLVAKLVRSVTPGSPWTVSIAVPLADANTPAVPSLWICAARSVDDPKSNVTVTSGFAVWKSCSIWVNALVRDEAANTVSGVDPAPGDVVVEDELEQATASRAITIEIAIRPIFLIRIPQPSRWSPSRSRPLPSPASVRARRLPRG